jgi:hypothetical protein
MARWGGVFLSGLRVDMILLLGAHHDTPDTSQLALSKLQSIVLDNQRRIDTGYFDEYCTCCFCSLRKGARQVSIDPQTQQEAPLFNPRLDRWTDHFRWDDVWAVGLTTTGRATVEALQMNRPLALEIRREEAARKRHPPP